MPTPACRRRDGPCLLGIQMVTDCLGLRVGFQFDTARAGRPSVHRVRMPVHESQGVMFSCDDGCIRDDSGAIRYQCGVTQIFVFFCSHEDL